MSPPSRFRSRRFDEGHGGAEGRGVMWVTQLQAASDLDFIADGEGLEHHGQKAAGEVAERALQGEGATANSNEVGAPWRPASWGDGVIWICLACGRLRLEPRFTSIGLLCDSLGFSRAKRGLSMGYGR